MAIDFGTAEWSRAVQGEINGSSEYRNAASKWGSGFNGNLLFAFEADRLLPKSLYLLLRLEGGRCSGAEFVAGASHPDAGFTLRAAFTIWREILEGKSLAATAILTGRMRVEGDRIALLKHVGAHRALIHCVASVEARFPGA
ncbi:MAG: SCP2 sterol-binding domain-containing protein [Candidatus Latescibacteria bacterium]|nr:SCP2 sterol-binding domain-containing protein [Candidatus Latescibacterota bacterium]